MRHAGACFALAFMGLVAPGRAHAEPAPLDARVLWTLQERVYIASTDSSRLGPGVRLTFVFRKKSVAAGEVTRVLDGEMVIARLTQGALPREKDLKRVRILVEPASGPGSLRVGYPSRARSTLFFACKHLLLVPPFEPGQFEIAPQDYRQGDPTRFRLIPSPLTRSRSAWPETLDIRLFDEAADEEIALERGEVDVAVFWPGELSRHMRDDPRWQHDLSAPMPNGVVVALHNAAAGGAGRTATIVARDPLMTALDRELFRGDLDEQRFAFERPAGAIPLSGVRFDVGSMCPGRAELERFLVRNQSSPPAADAPLARILFVNTPISLSSPNWAAVTEPATIGPGGETAFGGLHDELQVDVLFAIDCMVVFDAKLRPNVSAIGAKAFVELFDCDFGY